MADDPKKRKVDAWFLALTQPHEARYFLEQMKQEFPKKTEQQILDATAACADQIKPSEGRAKITECVRTRLK